MSTSDASRIFDSSSQELVLLVHGTFANDSGKSHPEKPRWWESGGDVWTRINEHLPEHFHVAEDQRTEVFSWSGENSERDRRASGRALFQHLMKLEFTNTRYHLVGHSHGGSVIWNCLQESVGSRLNDRRRASKSEYSLPGLRSWTTVGTPFLQLRSFGFASRVSPWIWFLVLIGSMTVLWLLLSEMNHSVQVLEDGLSRVTHLFHAGTGESGGGRPASDGSATPQTEISRLLPVILEHRVAGPALGVVTVLAAFMSMVMWAWASAVKLEAAVVREETRIRNQAFVDFGARWLGIWSRHDEAINGLRASLKLNGQIAPRIEVSGVTVFDFDRRMRTYRFLARWFIAPVFNLLISRPSDSIIWRSVSRGMQGNDRPGCLVSDVSPGPIVPRHIEWEQLPSSYDERLVKQSNDQLIARSRTLLPQLREVLSQLAWTRPEQLSLLLKNETTFEGNELVHTSYFHEPAIIDLIGCHILRHSRIRTEQAKSKSATSRWCRRFRHKARDLSRDPSLKSAALPRLGERNRRASVALLASVLLLAGLFGFVPVGGDDVLWSLFMDWGWLMALAVTLLAWSGIRRVKRGASRPRIARWGWNVSRVTLLLYLLLSL